MAPGLVTSHSRDTSIMNSDEKSWTFLGGRRGFVYPSL